MIKLKTPKIFSLFVIVTLFFLGNVAFSSPVGLPIKFIDNLLRDAGIVQVLARHNITGESATRVQNYVTNSLEALSIRGQDMTPAELRRTLSSGLSLTGDDLRLRNQLLEILEQNVSDLSQEQVVTAVNNLIYLANRHGVRGSVVLACSGCVSDSLRRQGFRFTFSSIENPNAQAALETAVPRNPQQLSSFIQTRMNSLQYADSYRAIPRDLLAPEEQRSLGLFLALADSGTETQREFISAVYRFSTDASGEARLFSQDNPHLFWRIFGDNPSDDQLRTLSQAMDEATNNSTSLSQREDAFFAALARRHGSNQEAHRLIDELRVNRCLFR